MASEGSKRRSTLLPTEIILEIFLLLTVKTLCKFRCVSRSWHALVSDPIFHRSYSRRPADDRRRVLLMEVPDCRCRSVDTNGTVTPVGNCGSTAPLLTVYTCLDLVCFFDPKQMYVWNPATREHIRVSLDHDEHRISDEEIVGFGYIQSTKEYKFLRVGPPPPARATVLTIGGGSIRRKRVNGPPSDICSRSAATINGVVYLHVAGGHSILRFDLEREEWSVTAGPPLPPEGYRFSRLRDLGGSLCVIRYTEDRRQLVWIQEGRGDWAEFKIDASLLTNPRPLGKFFLAPAVVPLAIMDDRRILLYTDTLPFPRLLYYDPKGCREAEVIYQHRSAPNESSRLQPPMLYTEGFTSPLKLSRPGPLP